MSEHELITQAVAGDDVALHQVLMLYHEPVTAFIEHKVPPDLRGMLAPEDVCQEALVTAVRELASFEPRGTNSFRNWLLTIAERELIDEIRALQAAKRGGGRRAVQARWSQDTSTARSVFEQAAAHDWTPSRSAAGHELVFAVQGALAGLQVEYQAAIRHRYLEGLSVAETAVQMGRTAGAVRMLCSRALQRLAAALGDVSRFFDGAVGRACDWSATPGGLP